MLHRIYMALLVAACLSCLGSAPALAGASLQGGTERYPGWWVNSQSYPTDLPPGGEGYIQIDVFDIGAAPSTGTVTIVDTLPAGVKYTGKQPRVEGDEEAEPWSCSGTTIVTCTNTVEVGGVKEVRELSGSAEHRIDLAVEVEADASGTRPNVVIASGGGALQQTRASDEIMLSAKPASFGFAHFEAWMSNPNGTIDTQAGSHPYEAVVSFYINNNKEAGSSSEAEAPVPATSEVEGATVNLPPGFVGDALAAPQCPIRLFDEEDCPASTQVGIDTALLGGFANLSFNLYNLVPPAGMPAQFGFDILGIKTFLDASVRTDGDYGISEHVDDIAQRNIVANQAIIWGVPSDPSHTPERCTAVEGIYRCGISEGGSSEVPFLTLPSSCGEAPELSVEADAWSNPDLTSAASYRLSNLDGEPVGMTGCNHLSLDPAVNIAPDTSYADTPAGLSVEIKIPQEGLLDDEELAPADLKNTKVVLPEGLVINPGQATGLQACQAAEDGLGTDGTPHCPNASKVGTVSIVTPLLPDHLEGDVYVLQSNPPELKLLMAASADGVNLKLIGTVHLNEQTGQLTTTFNETPALPFTVFKLAFSGGAQAALATPTECGTYTTYTDFTPWSAPFSPDLSPTSNFAIGAGTGGSACASPLPFAPSMIAGATTDQAGGYTGFSMLLQRGDDQQRISSLSFKTPEGLLGMISQVPLCPEPQASQGTCSSASQIGHTVVEAGPGPYPLVVPEAGQSPAPIYLTGGYKGAPFGLSIVVPLHVGPFTLATQVIRAKIEVDPYTSQLTITTDPLPTIVDGIPADLRAIDAVIDRPGFMFNPTNCEAQSFSGTATSTEGATAAISSHFQMGSCRALKFAPNFKVSTSGKTSKKDGASLGVKIVYPTGNLGANQASSQSNIKTVKVELPKQLPSRLTTLQKACTAQVFEANPANCPQASIVGHATAITPVLPVPLTGPAYFVSHGDEAFPSLIIVLQGYGVTIDLVGSTFISKAGITSSTFKQVPDVPIGSFELVLPEGPYSALAANGSLCKESLKMPTEFIGQDGAEIHQSTPITVTGCPKAKTQTKIEHKTKRHGGKRSKRKHAKHGVKPAKRRK